MPPDPILARIQSRLDLLESREDVRILLAVESGSRAWGFASTDSDWDVRFLYVYRPDWYLSIDTEHRRDVIEDLAEPPLDVSGWELRKALRLLRKSNPPLLEWLGSPLVYREHPTIAPALRALAHRYHDPRAARFHYLHMAEGNFREFLQGPEVRVKKYFYVLRPLLAVLWLERGLGLVPMVFDALVERLVPPGALRDAIADLLSRKRTGAELDRGPRIEPISAFIETELPRAQTAEPDTGAPPAPPVAPLDAAFRDALREAWGPEAPATP